MDPLQVDPVKLKSANGTESNLTVVFAVSWLHVVELSVTTTLYAPSVVAPKELVPVPTLLPPVSFH